MTKSFVLAFTAFALMAPVESEAQTQSQSAAYNNQHPHAWLNYQGGVRLNLVSSAARRAASPPVLRCGMCKLVNETGGDGG